MSEAVRIGRQGRVAVVTIDNPPVNALSRAVRLGLMAAMDEAEADEGIVAVVLCAAGRTFPVGADITEFGAPEAPALWQVCDRVEALGKPVVACLKGSVLGGGLELALAAHWRLAAPGTQVGFPEVKLGLLPGAGGTVRAPRLCGAGVALDLMLSGEPIGAEAAQEARLIDGIIEGDIEAAAARLAEDMGQEHIGLRPTRERAEGLADPVRYLQEVAGRRGAAVNARIPSESRIVDAVEAALLLPFDEAARFERSAFEDCLDTPESRALRHVFLAERRVAKVPELSQAVPQEVTRAGVVGGGTMGAEIAMALLDAGLPVVLAERDGAALAAAVERIEMAYGRAAVRGRLNEEEAARRLARLDTAVGVGALAGADLAIEAVPEDMALKQQVFGELDAVLGPEAILATNTSYLDVDELAAANSHPGRVLGLHFFAPARAMRALEVVVGRRTAPRTVATAFALARRLGKVAVRSGVCDGFIGNRVFGAGRTAVDHLLEDGASVEEIDAAMRGAGFALGPYQVADLSGLDIGWARRKRQAAGRDPAQRYVAVADLLCEAGRFGQKTGRGYYRYDAGVRAGLPDPEVAALIAAERERKGIRPRSVGAAQIRRRALAAMANEGARLVAEGIALRPSDVDALMVHGYGFPRWLGGPMQWADEAGLLSVQNDLRAWAEQEPTLWTPAPLWSELIKNGRKFGDLGA